MSMTFRILHTFGLTVLAIAVLTCVVFILAVIVSNALDRKLNDVQN